MGKQVDRRTGGKREADGQTSSGLDGRGIDSVDGVRTSG